MKKLRIKIFSTIFIILSLCLFSIVLIFGYQSYNREETHIEQNLFRINRFDKDIIDKNFLNFDKENFVNQIPKADNLRKFVDAIVYTIKLDENNNIVEIISH